MPAAASTSRKPDVSTPKSVLAIMAPPRTRDNPLTRSLAGILGIAVLAVIAAACLLTLPWTLGASNTSGVPIPRYNAGEIANARIPPSFVAPPSKESFLLGSDALGRSLLIRLLAGGGVSLAIGLAAAFLSVVIGTAYGTISGFIGGRVDAVMMRIVDILYGLPYVLLVVLLAVAADSVLAEYISREGARAAWMAQRAAERGSATPLDAVAKAAIEAQALAAIPPRQVSPTGRAILDLGVLLIAIGGVSWLTMARVIRGQVLSLKQLPFVESARAIGASRRRIIFVHLLPNLVGPITVYAALTVPQAILQESFLSFLGIGVKPPLPSWGNLAAEGLPELNPFQSNWWLLLFPCLALGITLLALNFVGEGIREALDPKRARA
jgi:ABC-type dipeptide/oligopeptide/nickel transport system permease subunit